jgi:glycosyltransferase involved in cell wall biosynthesis
MRSDKKGKRIASLVQLPRNVSPGQRFRIEQFEPGLSEAGYVVDTFPFIGTSAYAVLYQKGFLFRKALGVLKGFVKRTLFLFQAYRYDFIFLQREATPVGPPVFEWLLAKVLRKKIILDFDDAIWIADATGTGRLLQALKCFWKIKYLCRWSYKVSVGNDYLAAWARQYNNRVVLIPTCVDTQQRYNRLKEHTQKNPVTIGWTGSHSTLPFLDLIYPVLKRLDDEKGIELLVICDRPPAFRLSSLQFIPWNKNTEIEDLLKMDIGIMPLETDSWSEGKCGFKLIQYGALGIPSVASPVGVNKNIITPHTGYLCSTPEEWYTAIRALMDSVERRTSFGAAARQKVAGGYSLHANSGAFRDLFT